MVTTEKVIDIDKIESIDDYKRLYSLSINDPELFWSSVAGKLSWKKKWEKIRDFDFVSGKSRWFENGKLNICYNCVDRHVEQGRGNRIAFFWEGNDSENKEITYSDLLREIKKFSNVLKKHGIKKGDRVCIYMQMIPEAIIAMLSCARIGAIHSVVFGAFSSESLKDRINDADCSLLITQDSANRGGKRGIPMKGNADEAVLGTKLKKIIVVNRNNSKISMEKERDFYWDEEMANADSECPFEIMDAEDPLFILYTSGSTGKPKGVLHSTGGYIVYTNYSFRTVFDYRENDIFWCTADIGWITGHSYIVYGPLSNCASSVIFEGIPNYPNFGRFWNIIDKYKVNIFYTSPTALRSLMKEGNDWPDEYDLSSLRVLGTVGEPIKEKEWAWYHEVIGKGKCQIVDTWWQTETGGIMISPIAKFNEKMNPGSVGFPFFGIEPAILDEKGLELKGEVQGYLAIKSSWPSIMRTVYGNHERFKETYFSKFPGYYFTGDGARRDRDGNYRIIGRVDDVINVSGHRIGTAEVEGAIGKTKGIAEAAVVPFPDEIKGQGVYAFVTPMNGTLGSLELENKIRESVKKQIGPHAVPGKIQFTHSLPKTRSGKIMRRILRKIAEGDLDDLGDTSTLLDESVIDFLIKEKMI